MADPLTIIGGAVIALSLGVIFVLSLAEASLLSAPDVALRRLAEQGNRRAQTVQRLKSDHEYLSAIIVGVNTAVILVATVMPVLVQHHLGPGESWHAELWHVGTVVVILVFAELTPKTWGALSAMRIALAIAPVVARLTAITKPVVRVVTKLSNLVLGGPPPVRGHDSHFITAAEIQAAADIGEEEGMVEREEGEMLDSVIELKETEAREILVPRVDIVAAPETATLEDVVALAVESGHSRIPVYRHTIDTITGILYVTDLLRELRAGRRDVDLTALARAPVFVPETKRISDLFRELADRQVHIAIVLDEFGGTEGLVTIEDILEELVGEIADEHDVLEEEIVEVSDTEALVDGNTRIVEVNVRLGLGLPEDEYETVGGLVAGRMGRIPAVGEKLREGRVVLCVEQGTEQHVERVRITHTDKEGGDV